MVLSIVLVVVHVGVGGSLGGLGAERALPVLKSISVIIIIFFFQIEIAKVKEVAKKKSAYDPGGPSGRL